MSTPTPVWRVVAAREITTKLRDKTFVGATALTLVILIVVLVVTSLIGNSSSRFDVAVTGSSDVRLLESAEKTLQAQGLEDGRIDPHEVGSVAAADDLVRGGDADAALVPRGDGYQLVGDSDVDPSLASALRQAVAGAAVAANAEQQDVDLAALNRGTEVGQRLLDPNADETGTRKAVAFAFAIVFFMTALGFGMSIAQSVVQEKESRVVEILAAAVPIRAMLWGKIIGNTALALGQVVLNVTVGVIGLAVTGRAGILSGIGPAVLWYLAFFVLGFLALAALWSVAGSLATRQEDLQSTTLPGQLVLGVPYFVSVLANDDVKTVVSMLPIASTMVMPGRMAEGSVPWWQVAVGIALTVAAAVVFVRIGSRLYERTLLRTGGKIGYRDAFRLSA